jgi:hypothetical protein
MSIDIWTNFSQGILNYSLDAYGNLQPWFYPLFFFGIIGYVYSATHSVITAVVAILITFGLYGATTDIFNAVPDYVLFMNIVVLIGISALIFTLLINKVVK